MTDEVGELVVTEPMPSMPRHVPDAILQVPDIPVTLTGKKIEVPVRRILQGTPPEAANRDAMANPASLEAYVSFASQWPTVGE